GEVAAGMIVEHAYESSGNFTATLVVIDDDGATSSDSIRVYVREMKVEKEAGGFDWSLLLLLLLVILIVLAVINLLYQMRKSPPPDERVEEVADEEGDERESREKKRPPRS
ncbi:MAG: PKD domain-containing protein, partial [Thermoplasmata archaeon]